MLTLPIFPRNYTQIAQCSPSAHSDFICCVCSHHVTRAEFFELIQQLGLALSNAEVAVVFDTLADNGACMMLCCSTLNQKLCFAAANFVTHLFPGVPNVDTQIISLQALHGDLMATRRRLLSLADGEELPLPSKLPPRPPAIPPPSDGSDAEYESSIAGDEESKSAAPESTAAASTTCTSLYSNSK